MCRDGRVRLAANIGLRSIISCVERVEVLLEPLLGRDAGIDAQRTGLANFFLMARGGLKRRIRFPCTERSKGCTAPRRVAEPKQMSLAFATVRQSVDQLADSKAADGGRHRQAGGGLAATPSQDFSASAAACVYRKSDSAILVMKAAEDRL